MKSKVCIFTAFILSILFTSCFSNFKTQRESSVTFNLDKETVSKILESSIKYSSSSRAAGRAAVSDLFIDVSLCGDFEQTKTVPVEDEIQVKFTEVPVNSRVYAKAQVYKYTDSQKTEKNVIYRGQSQTIVVRDTGNVLSIKLGVAALTITFDSNGGSAVESQTVLTGECVQYPSDPVKPADKKPYSRDDNNAFAGWYTDAALTKAYDFNLPVTDDLTLYAKWLPDFVFVQGDTVKDYLAAGRNVRISDLFVSDHEVTQAEYYAVTKNNPSNHTTSEIEKYPVENVTWFDAIEYCNLLSIKEGLTPCYTINGSTDPAGWGETNSQTTVTCSLSSNGYRLPTEAEWEYVSKKSYRSNRAFEDMVLYSANSQNSTQTVDNRLADELCLCNILGNVAEWCFDVYSDSISRSTNPTGPIVISGAENKRVIRGGSYQSSQTECSSTARASASPTEKSGAIGFRVVRTVVYEYRVIKNTVTFDSKGGSAVSAQVVIDGETATQPANPARTGYDFKGWKYADEDFDFSTPVTQDITLEAKWQAIVYTIGYDMDGGRIATPNPTTYTIETETFILNTPIKDNYNFKGWFNGSQKVTKIEKGSHGDLNLVAQWTQCHIVTFDKQDGSAVTEQEVENNQTVTEPAPPTRTNFTFVHWYDATGNENTAFDFTTQITGNITLKALWQIIDENLGGINVSFGVETGDIAVTTTEETTTITYTANSGYGSYSWFLDNDEQLSYHNQSTCIITKPTTPGVYDVYLEAVKDGVTYTWTQNITVTN